MPGDTVEPLTPEDIERLKADKYIYQTPLSRRLWATIDSLREQVAAAERERDWCEKNVKLALNAKRGHAMGCNWWHHAGICDCGKAGLDAALTALDGD